MFKNQIYIGYPILKEREEGENLHELDRYYTTIVVAKNMEGAVFIVNKYDDLKQKLYLTTAEWDWLGKNREEINQLWHSQGEGNGLYYENCGNQTLYIKLTTYQVKHGSIKGHQAEHLQVLQKEIWPGLHVPVSH